MSLFIQLEAPGRRKTEKNNWTQITSTCGQFGRETQQIFIFILILNSYSYVHVATSQRVICFFGLPIKLERHGQASTQAAASCEGPSSIQGGLARIAGFLIRLWWSTPFFQETPFPCFLWVHLNRCLRLPVLIMGRCAPWCSCLAP